MKKHLLIFLVCLLAKNSYSQSYIPFPEDSAQWSVWHYFNGGNSVESIQYKMKGDTILNGIIYSKVYKSYELYYGANDTDLHCYIRQDTTLKLVYVKYPYNLYQDSSEFILYNFNMQVSDTITIKLIASNSFGHLIVDLSNIGFSGYGPTPYYSLLTIDSCMGSPGCLWGVACDGLGILQGIGSVNNYFLYTEMPPMHCYMWGDNSYNLQCFWYKGQYILGGNFCDYATGIKEQTLVKLNPVQPNPVSDISILKNSKGLEEALVFDLTGKFLCKLNRNDENDFQIIASEFANGYYFLKAVNSDNQFYETHFVVVK